MKMASCIIVALILVVLPLARSHRAGVHFRTHEARRSVERHTFLEQSKVYEIERVHPATLRFAFVALEDAPRPLQGFVRTPQLPITRLLLRLKLGLSSSGSPDPLLPVKICG